MPQRRPPNTSAADHPAIAARVRTRRAAQQLTQLALANALGITFEQLRQHGAVRQRINARRLQEIASILRVPATGLYNLDSPSETAGPTPPSPLDSAGAMRLMRAYAALPTPRIKRALVALAERMAGRET